MATEPPTADPGICTTCGWPLQSCNCCGLCGEPSCSCAKELSGDTTEPLPDGWDDEPMDDATRYALGAM